MAIVNGQEVNRVAIGGDIFIKKVIGSRITIPAQTHIYVNENLNDTSAGLGTTSIVTRDCSATVIGTYCPSNSDLQTVQVEGIPKNIVSGDLTSGWIKAKNLDLGR